MWCCRIIVASRSRFLSRSALNCPLPRCLASSDQRYASIMCSVSCQWHVEFFFFAGMHARPLQMDRHETFGLHPRGGGARWQAHRMHIFCAPRVASHRNTCATTRLAPRASRLASRVSRPANFFSLGCDPSLLYVVKGKGRRARLRSLHNVLVKAMLALQLISACQGILGTLDVHVAEVERLL